MARLLVTGAAGFIGSWVIRHLLEDGDTPLGLEIGVQTHRLRMLGVDNRFPMWPVDVRDSSALGALVDRERPDAIIHLAALQIPPCRANPAQCVEINVGGMMNVLEVSRARGLPLVYTSSAAVFGPDLGRTLDEDEGVFPQSLYGVFKRANEEMARVYAQDYGVRSAGFRPYVVYGPGRDVGLTSDITVALWHAARGDRFHIGFGGTVALQHASDVARALILAARRSLDGARVYNLLGSLVAMPEVVRAIEKTTGTSGLVTHEPAPLPIAADLSDRRFQRDLGPFAYLDLESGFRQTLEIWKDTMTA